MKTVREWFETIEDEDIRNKALANMDDHAKDEKCDNLTDALFIGFIWEISPEGHKYWQDFKNTL